MTGGPDYAAISAALYGSQQIVNDPAPTGEGILSPETAPPDPGEGEPVEGAEGAEPAPFDWADGDPGDEPPVGGYGYAVDGLMQDWGLLTRQNGEEYPGQEADIRAAQAGLNDAFQQAGLGQREAKSIMKEVTALHFGHSKPPTRSAALATLRQQHGAALDQRLDAARKVLAEAETKIPHLRGYLVHTQAGNSPAVINACIRAARKRGYC